MGHDCDLVMIDYSMPRMDGVETCARIRQQEQLSNLSVMVFTGHADRDSRLRAKRAGADDFLTKPIDQIELLVRVKNLIKVKAYHDLKDRQRELLEKELAVRTSQLIRAERLATLGTLAGGVGHELNNITTIHLLAVDSLRRSICAGELPRVCDLDALDRVGEHLKMHGTNLLRLGRPSSQTVEVLDLRVLTQSTLDLLGRMGRTSRVTVETDFPEQEMPVMVCQAHIEQVILNLVGNAADALGSSIPWPRTIQVKISAAGPEHVECYVIDNGIGIPEDKLESVFEPYYTTKEADKGTGLGLPVVKKLVEDLGGDLRVESQHQSAVVAVADKPVNTDAKPKREPPKTGSMFVFRLPFADRAAGSPA